MADTRAGNDVAEDGAIPYPESQGGELWDKLTLGPHTLPGVWTVRGKITRRIDVKTSKSQDGARFRDQGYEPAKLQFVGRMIGPTDFATMVRAAAALSPRRRGVAMEPLQCDHPALTYLGVGNVLIQSVDTPRRGANGIPEFSLDALEWVPKPKRKPQAADLPRPTGSLGEIQRGFRDSQFGVSPAEANAADAVVSEELARLAVLSDLATAGALVEE